MTKKLLIVVATVDCGKAEEVAAPFFQATIAAALGYDVEILLTAQAVQLAEEGYAAGLAVENGQRSIYDLIHEAYEAGVIIKVVTPTLSGWSQPTLSEIDETVGSSYLITEAMEDDCVTLTY